METTQPLTQTEQRAYDRNATQARYQHERIFPTAQGLHARMQATSNPRASPVVSRKTTSGVSEKEVNTTKVNQGASTMEDRQ